MVKVRNDGDGKDAFEEEGVVVVVLTAGVEVKSPEAQLLARTSRCAAARGR